MMKNNDSGITLIALVVTIIVTLILAGISISMLIGQNGILDKAKIAKESAELSQQQEEKKLLQYEQLINDSIDERTLLTTINYTNHDNIYAKDIYGNKITIPGGFKISADSGQSVDEGIVIEDETGNEFVWIPISNINGDGSGIINTADGRKLEIVLGRYNFSNSIENNYSIVQYGNEYESEIIFNNTFTELKEFMEADESSVNSTINATSKNLKMFINSVDINKGYYLGRYEASYASGEKFGIGDNNLYYKPYEKKSILHSQETMEFKDRNLWNYITQGEASIVSRQMYYGNNFVESDLINSFAWDSTLVYIQKVLNNNYWNKSDGNGKIHNTGDDSINDQQCRIFDLSGNCREWTTEHSNGVDSYGTYPCTDRGGTYYTKSKTTSFRSNAGHINNKNAFIGFRVMLYLK